MSSLPGESSLYDLDETQLGALCSDQPGYRHRQIWDGLYTQLRTPDELTNIPKGLRERISADAPLALTLVTEQVTDSGSTIKSLWGLDDGARVESVLMYYDERTTVCVSSQAGCAMGCGFCATGQAGFTRHLSVGEIVEQVVRAARRAAIDDSGNGGPGTRRLDNVVFMGMGEPLANYERVWAALARLQGAIGISARHLTVSTVGLTAGIRRMADEKLPVNLAVSLHAANDRLRDELVPINRRHNLAELADACHVYLAAKGRRLSLEWAMIDGVNDRDSDAVELAAYARSLRAHVNLIPLNPTPGYATIGSPPSRVRAFRELLVGHGVNATIRQNRGTDIGAACGQLAAGQDIPVAISTSPGQGT